MDGITIITAYTIMLSGKIDDLDSMARLIASTVKDVQVLLIKYQTGWRLQLICKDETSLNACSIIIRDRVLQGMVVTVLNGKHPMPTRIYTAS